MVGEYFVDCGGHFFETLVAALDKFRRQFNCSSQFASATPALFASRPRAAFERNCVIGVAMLDSPVSNGAPLSTGLSVSYNASANRVAFKNRSIFSVIVFSLTTQSQIPTQLPAFDEQLIALEFRLPSVASKAVEFRIRRRMRAKD
jgi:hypothetical protein